MRRAQASVVTLVVASCLGVFASGAAADPGRCAVRDAQGYCVEWDVSMPGDQGTPGGSGGEAPECYWVTIDEDLAEEDPAIWFDFELERPPPGVEIIWQSWECSDGRPTFDVRWVVAPVPANLATIARGRLAGALPQPVVTSSPPVGTASIVGVAVFVAVDNWTGVITDTECAGGLCVTVTATPALTYQPGEPSSRSVLCAGSGTRYSASGGSLDAQASVPGACAYAYRLRTGAAGRPSVWPGEVSVTWTISWTATSGASGVLAPVTRSTAMPRGVSEVQTVVSGGETP